MTLMLAWYKHDNCIYKYTKCKHWNWNFSIDLIDLKTLNDCFSKTTYLIELKLTGLIEQVNDGLYTNFQSILNFHKNFGMFTFKLYRAIYGLEMIHITKRIEIFGYLD